MADAFAPPPERLDDWLRQAWAEAGSGSDVGRPVIPASDRRRTEIQGHHDSEGSAWRCSRCDHDVATLNFEGQWECLQCLGTDFYQPNRPHRRETDRGVWLFMPAATEATSSSTSSSSMAPTPNPQTQHLSRRQRRAMRRAQHGPPDGEGGFGSERAESEVPTDDPIVEPEGGYFRPRRQTGAGAARPWTSSTARSTARWPAT